jgi:hypothetical protein
VTNEALVPYSYRFTLGRNLESNCAELTILRRYQRTT